MDEILTFLMLHCSFLYKKLGFRFIDSLYSPESFGNAYLDLATKDMKVRFTLDRNQLLFDFQPKGVKEWYSVDIVRNLITNELVFHGIMDQENAEFIKANFTKIQELFSEPMLNESKKRMKKLEAIRSKQMFG